MYKIKSYLTVCMLFAAGLTATAVYGQTTPAITMTAVTKKIMLKIENEVNTSIVAVDWGDGIKEEFLSGALELEHDYTKSFTYKITITGANLYYFDCSNTGLTSLNVSGATALKKLDCSENRLTSLDVSKNTALKTLRCMNNLIGPASLNDLFGTLNNNPLPPNERKDIIISGNPGRETCNKNIATEKGWEVIDR